MSESSARTLVSEAEFLRLPESADRIELIDGEVIVSPSPSYWHQETLRRILVALSAWAGRQTSPVVIGQSPLDVRFAPGRILQPDAFVILDHAIARDHEGPIDRVPDLCIEVLSADRTYDRITKRFVYAAAGVSEYWVVEPAGLIERFSGKGLAVSEEIRGTISSLVLPGLVVDLDQVFA
jgi:Uma2 family endonuclease